MLYLARELRSRALEMYIVLKYDKISAETRGAG